MRLKKFTLLAVLMGFLLIEGNAMALSLLQPYTGPIFIKLTDYENIVTATGQTLAGIFNVSSIEEDNPSTTLLWYSGLNNEQLTGTFNGYVVNTITPTGSNQVIDFKGGTIDVYFNNSVTQPFNADPPTTGTNVTAGSLFLTMQGIPGIISGDTTDTLTSTLTSLTNPFTGNGAGYLELTGGAGAALFGGVGSTLLLQTNLQAPAINSTWPASGQDPITGQITGAPEPGTLFLLSAGLLGLGVFGRKRMVKN